MIRKISIGIDIGTHMTRVVIAEHKKGDALPKIIGTGSSETTGLKKGYIINIADASKSIKAAISDAEKSSGVKIKNALVSIGGISLSSETSTGQAIVSKADKEVTDLDIQKAIASSEDSLELVNKKIIHSFPILFKLDGKEIHGRPEGMRGIKLEVKTLFITCLEQHLDDLVTAVTEAGVDVLDIIASPIAESVAVLNDQQKQVGCVLADVGAETVSIVVFENGHPISLQVFPIGGTNITQDIALGFKIALEDAEGIKKGNKAHEFPKRKLDEIIEARLSDIFELIDNHLKKIRRSGLLPAGVIISGGGSNITSIEDMSKHILRLPSKIAVTYTNNKMRDASWFVSTGLALIGKNSLSEYGSQGIKGNVKSFKKMVKNFLSQLMP